MRIKASLLALSLIAASPEAALAQHRAAPESRAQVQLSFAPIVKGVAPSVVNVYGARVEKSRRSAGMDEFVRRFFGEPGGGGTPQERVQRSLGSGVVVDAAAGLVVTNNHVIDQMTEVKVSLADHREIEAEIVLRDPRTDLAVLKLKSASGLKAIDVGDADEIEVGDIVLAIGNPFGVGQTVTQGIVSALARTNVGVSDYGYFIQTDASINPGNSGGALVDMHGRLIGINSAIFSQSGGSVGIGFAIPSSMVETVIASARAGAKLVRRPWLGASLQTVSADIADGLGLDRPTGALVASVRDKSPAHVAGLKSGDVILAVDGRSVDDPDAFGWRFALKGITGETPVTINRAGKREIVAIHLQPPPELPARDTLKVKVRSPFLGATVVNASPAVADEMQLESSDGVIVSAVEEGSPASTVGLQKGDRLVAINGDKMSSTRDLDRVARSAPSMWRITIDRAGQQMTTVLGG